MFYYRDELPQMGTIVIAVVSDTDENDSCIYTTLPEYNNCQGVIYKRELPKKVKQQKKILSEMKHAGTIVCVVSNSLTTSTISSKSKSEIIELSIKGVDPKHHANIITRYKNIEKILKIVKFVSQEFGYTYKNIIKKIHENIITPLTDINGTDKVNDYGEIYQNFLRNHKTLVELMNLESKDSKRVNKKLNNMITELPASSSLNFDLFVWKGDKDNRDAIFVLRDVFDVIKNSFKDQNIELRYLGAPKYQINLMRIDLDKINDMYL